jgi:hypothetical protein
MENGPTSLLVQSGGRNRTKLKVAVGFIIGYQRF